MPLTDTQKATVRMYLGYSDQSRSAANRANLEGALVALSSDAVTQVTAILASIATVETSLTTVNSSARAGIKSVDNGGVVWADDGRSASRAVTDEGRRFVRRLSVILGVPVASDVFGSSVPTSGPCPRG